MLLSRLGMRLALLAAAMLALLPLPAQAAVELTFYTRDLGTQFPHAFVTLVGTPDRGGERIDTNYGFTATAVTPALLFGAVRGRVEAVGDGYVRASDAHFSVTLTDSELDRVMAAAERWRTMDQPSYHLKRRNCVHFIADMAAAIGMTAETPRNLMRRPRAFAESLIRANRQWLAQRGARILREPREGREEREERRRGGGDAGDEDGDGDGDGA
jgi:hypothetical protein